MTANKHNSVLAQTLHDIANQVLTGAVGSMVNIVTTKDNGDPIWRDRVAQWVWNYYEEAWLKLAPLGAYPTPMPSDTLWLTIPFFTNASIYLRVDPELPGCRCSYQLKVPAVNGSSQSVDPEYLVHTYDTWDAMLADLVVVLDAEAAPHGINKTR